jgi:hypothetical protein
MHMQVADTAVMLMPWCVDQGLSVRPRKAQLLRALVLSGYVVATSLPN